MASRITKLSGGSSHFLFISDVIYTITFARKVISSVTERKTAARSKDMRNRLGSFINRNFQKLHVEILAVYRVPSTLHVLRDYRYQTCRSIERRSLAQEARAATVAISYASSVRSAPKGLKDRVRATCFVTINRR